MLSEEQIELLERHSVDFRCRHFEASRPGELLNHDTFYWGMLKGVGNVYVQVVVDVFCSLAFAKVYKYKLSDSPTPGFPGRADLKRLRGTGSSRSLGPCQARSRSLATLRQSGDQRLQPPLEKPEEIGPDR